MKILNLGAGNHIWKGVINHDLTKHRPEIDVAHDLNVRPWPWADSSWEQIGASSIFEHLQIDLVAAMDECWRILQPQGLLRVKVPYWHHDNAYADPTHRQRYSLRSFNLFVPNTKLGKELRHYTARKWRFVKRPRFNDQKSSILAVMRPQKAGRP